MFCMKKGLTGLALKIITPANMSTLMNNTLCMWQKTMKRIVKMMIMMQIFRLFLMYKPESLKPSIISDYFEKPSNTHIHRYDVHHSV